MKVSVDKEKCISCGLCLSICPNVFQYDKDHKSEVKEKADLDKNDECVCEAINSCPTQAIYRG